MGQARFLSPFIVALHLAGGFGLSAAEPAAQNPGDDPRSREQSWIEDIDYLVSELERRHPNPYHSVPEDVFDERVSRLEARLGTMTDPEVVVELSRIMALVGDGHTGIFIPWDEQLGYGRLPIEVWQLGDRLVIAGAVDEGLAGSEILRVGDVAARDLLDILDEAVPRDNEFSKTHVRELASIPEVLVAVGASSSSDVVVMTVRDSKGNIHDVSLRRTPEEPKQLVFPYGSRELPSWIDRRDEKYWYARIPQHRALYIQYNDASWQYDELTLVDFTEEVVRIVENEAIHRVVVDVRWNDGGSPRWTNILLHGLVRIERLIAIPRGPSREPNGKIYLLIGPGTFSAAMLFSVDVLEHTNALLVGLPSGGRPNFYSTRSIFRLPNSGLEARSSITRFESGDGRVSVTPDLAVRMTIEDLRAGRDPVLETALEYEPGPGLAETLRAMLESGRSDELAAAIRKWRRDPLHEFRSAEPIVNGFGYEILSSGRADWAVAIFQANVENFPQSANAYDSLGEARLAAGDAKGAREAYQRAIRLDPDGPVGANSRTMLQRIDQ